MKVILGPPDTGLCLGRLATTGTGVPEHPSRICSVTANDSRQKSVEQQTLQAIDASGTRRRIGQVSNVEPGQHFLLMPRPGGSFELRQVSSWFAFGLPETCEPGKSEEGDPEERSKKAELDMKQESKRRRLDENRWELMKRKGQVVEPEAESVAWTPTPAMPSKLQDKINGPQVLHPEAPDEDDFGVETAKRIKEWKRKAEHFDGEHREDHEVPDSAAGVLGLKTENGHAGWDFSDAEHSDDEKGSDYDEMIFVGNDQVADEAEENVSADEEDAPEKGELLTNVGLQIDAALQQQSKEGDVDDAAKQAAMELQAIIPAGDSDDSASGDEVQQEQVQSSDVRSGPAAAPGAGTVAAPNRKRPHPNSTEASHISEEPQGVLKTLGQASGTAVASSFSPPDPAARVPGKGKGRGNPKAQAKKDSRSAPDSSMTRSNLKASQATSEKENAQRVVAKAAPEVQVKERSTCQSAVTAPAEVVAASSSGESAGSTFRARALQFLREVQQTTVKDLSTALGIKKMDRTSPEYNKIVTVLKELTDVEKTPGQSKAVFKLKPEFR